MSDKKYTPALFIYQGRRWSVASKSLFDAVMPLNEQGEPARANPMLFDHKAKRMLVVGGVHSGAEFCDDGARGIETARYERKWAHEGNCLEWVALDDEADASAKSHKLLKDERRLNEFEQILLPLRKQYHSPRLKYDGAAQQAMVNAMIRALRTPLRKDEEGGK